MHSSQCPTAEERGRNDTAPVHLPLNSYIFRPSSMGKYQRIFPVFPSKPMFFPLSVYKDFTNFHSKILGRLEPPARPWTRSRLDDTTRVSASTASRCHWRRRRSTSADACRQSPASTIRRLQLSLTEHRTPFQNRAVISPPRDEVLLVHVHVFVYARPEIWLKAMGKVILSQ